MEWELFEERDYKICEISVFDDGKKDYMNYSNKWYIIGSWRGKFRLQNIENKNIFIESISNWKLKKVLNETTM